MFTPSLIALALNLLFPHIIMADKKTKSWRAVFKSSKSVKVGQKPAVAKTSTSGESTTIISEEGTSVPDYGESTPNSQISSLNSRVVTITSIAPPPKPISSTTRFKRLITI